MHSSVMGEIHGFILRRAYEDASAAVASIARAAPEESRGHSRLSGRDPNWGARRVLAECEVKSEIVSIHADGACLQCVADPEQGCETVRLLAQAWSDHPDFRSAWSGFHLGDSQVSPSMATEILEELSRPDCPPVVKLTDRETEVLSLIAEAVSYHDIGEQLFISTNTVKNHARNSVQKSQWRRRLGDPPDPANWPA
jgi:Family of unknown function (DUF6221)/Bacterial regulatory proteins, luxR family